jgi:SAM-dependent methyltransferase
MPNYIYNSCPICKNNIYNTIGTADKGDLSLNIPNESKIVKCKFCKVIYISPFPQWTDEDFKMLYGSSYFGEDSHEKKWLNIRAKKNTEDRYLRIKKYLSSKSNTFLEVGSGIFALMSHHLIKKQWSVVAQEPAEELCKELSKVYPQLKTINTPFLEIAEATKYSVIYADSVFEHLCNPIEYFKKSSQLLEDGGILYLICPNEYSFTNWIRTLINKFTRNPVHYLSPYKSPYHLIGFSKKSIKIAAKESGLTLIKFIKRYDYFWFHAFRKIKNPVLKYPVAFLLYIMDRLGFGGNLEIILKK